MSHRPDSYDTDGLEPVPVSPMVRWVALAIVLGCVLVTGAVVQELVAQFRKDSAQHPNSWASSDLKCEQKATVKPDMTAAGAEGAPLKVVCYMNATNSCQGENAHLLRAVATALPKRVRLTFVDTGSPDGSKVASKAGVTCQATFTINGNGKHKLVRPNGKEETVEYHGPLAGVAEADLELVFATALKQKLGPQFKPEELAALHQGLTDAIQHKDAKPAKDKAKADVKGKPATAAPSST